MSVDRMRRASALLPLVALAVGVPLLGCQSGHIPDPNDPADVGALSPDIIRRNLSSVTESLTNRYARGEIDERTYKRLVAMAAAKLVKSVDPNTVTPDQAWEYGEVLRDAQQWPQAEAVLRVARKYALATRNEDRRVNDTLRLAYVIARQGRIPEALSTARETFDAKPSDSAPILLAVYLEIAPAAKGKGYDYELAKLIEDAIPIHERTQVDPNSEAGKAFLNARRFHVRNAWKVAAQLYRESGHPNDAARAESKVTPRFTEA